MITDKQRTDFKKYLSDNAIEQSSLKESDLQEFVQTGTVNKSLFNTAKPASPVDQNIPEETIKEEKTPDLATQQKDILELDRKKLREDREVERKANKGDVPDITYKEDDQPYDSNKVISKAPIFKGSDGKQYQTVRNSDNTLTTIDVETGEAVTGKYTDKEREGIKQGFLEEQVDDKGEITPVYDSNSIYASLLNGDFIDKDTRNTTDYKKAYDRKLRLDTFSNMSANDLANSISEGAFLPGTQVYDDLKIQNPKLVSDAEKLNTINAVNGKKIDATNIKTKIFEALTNLMNDSDKETYADKLSSNQDILHLNDNLNKSAVKMAEYKDQMEYVKEDIEKDLGGKSVTKGYKNFLIGERGREIRRSYTLELAKYNATAGQIQTLSDNIKYEYEQEKQDKQDEFDNLTKTLGLYQELTKEDRALAYQRQQQILQSGDLNSDDEFIRDTAITNAVNSLYTLYPIPGMESPTAKIQKVKALIEQGMTPQQAINSLEQEIRNSDRYKKLIAGDTSEITPEFTKLDDKTIFDKRTGEFKTIGETGYDFVKSQEGFRDKAYWDVNGWAIGYGQHSINGVPVKEGDTIDRATADQDFENRIQNAKFNGLVTVDLTENQKSALYDLEHNAGPGVWDFPNGKKIIDLVNEGKFKEASDVMANSGIATTNAATGEVMPVLVNRRKQASQLLIEEKEEYSKEAQDWGQNIFKGRAKLSDIVSNPELRTEVSSYIANNRPVYTEDDPMVISIDKDIKALDSIVDWKPGGFLDTDNESLAEDVSGGFQFSPFDSLTGKKQQFLRKVQTVLDSQALKNLIDVKNMGATFGALTEKEMAILQKASSSLNASANRDDDGNITGFTMDEEEFKSELSRTLQTAKNLKKNLLGESKEETGGRVKGKTGGRIK